ncbi:MAG: aminotransferase class III-fold pyridoxal phosphate-dependent enzyme [Bacillota bacterium]
MVSFIETYKQRTPGSAALYERAARVMPGGVCHNPRFYPPYPVYLSRAEGSRIWDVDGNEYIDLWMGHYSHILGHNPELLRTVIAETAAQGTHWGIVHEHQIAYAEDLCRVIPSVERVRFGVSGTEATMYAVRLARAYTGRKAILKVRGGWHGSGSELVKAVHSPMDIPESAGILPEVMEYTKTISFNDTEGTVAAIRQCGSDLAAVIIEAVGQNFVPPHPNYLETVQAETRKAGAVFILDEVITGGRLGPQGGQGLYGLSPDLTTMGKVLGGGMALGMVGGRKEIMDLADPTRGLPKGRGVIMGGGTFSAMPPAMRAGKAIFNYLEEHAADLYPSLQAKGERVRTGVEEAFREVGISVRCFGVGSLYSVTFPKSEDADIYDIETIETRSDVRRRDHEFRLRMLNHGVYTMWGGGAISDAHSEEDLDRIIAAARAVAREMAAEQ